MAEKVAKLGIKRDSNFMYYIKKGDVWRVPRKRPGKPKGKPERVSKAGVEMDYDYIYFLDKNGDVAHAKRAVGGQKRKKKKPAKKKVAKKKKAAPKKQAAPAPKPAPAPAAPARTAAPWESGSSQPATPSWQKPESERQGSGFIGPDTSDGPGDDNDDDNGGGMGPVF